MLDVGLVVEIKPLDTLDLKVGQDGAKLTRAKLAKKGSTFEAQHELKLLLEGLAELTIRGGKADARAEVEKLDARWRSEAEPILEACAGQGSRGACGDLGRVHPTSRRATDVRAGAQWPKDAD